MKTPKKLEGIEAFREYVIGLCRYHGYREVRRMSGLSASHLSNIIHGYGCIGAETAARFGYSKHESVTFIAKEGVK